jgi:hypothetical protein
MLWQDEGKTLRIARNRRMVSMNFNLNGLSAGCACHGGGMGGGVPGMGGGLPGMGGLAGGYDPTGGIPGILAQHQMMSNMMMTLFNAMWMTFMAQMIQSLGSGISLPGGNPAFGGGSGAGNPTANFLGSGGGGGTAATGASGGASSSGTPGPGVQGALDKARSMLGLNESRDRAKIQEVTGKSGINPATTPWCAAFAMNILKDAGVLNLDGLSNRNYCPTIVSWAKDKGIWGPRGSYQPKPGDAIMFDWQGDGTSDHIGIVEKVENGKVITIEGNSSNSVKRNTYDLGSGKIMGYVIGGKPHGK